jgi:hypothetical protein
MLIDLLPYNEGWREREGGSTRRGQRDRGTGGCALHEARGAGHTWCEIGLVRPCEARGVGTHGARREVQGRATRGGSNATVQGPRCRSTRREARSARTSGARRVRPVRTKGGSITVQPTNKKPSLWVKKDLHSCSSLWDALRLRLVSKGWSWQIATAATRDWRH